MGRPGLTQHRKFRRLARALGGDALARGCLELLWDACYEPGDDFLGDSEDVEAAARWTGAPGLLTKALLGAGGEASCGFIEEIEDRPGRYRVHDLWHHAPDYVRKRRSREAQRRAKADPVATDGGQWPDADRSGDGQRQPSPDCQDGLDLPPAPAPAPEGKTLSSKPKNGFDRERDEIVLSVWNYYLSTIGRNPKLYTLTEKRKRMGLARVRDLWSRVKEPKAENVVALMNLCVDRLKASKFHNGDNERSKKYLDWDILFRSTEQMEKWLNDDGVRQ